MKTCVLCQATIPYRVTVDGVLKKIPRRKYCFDCSPLGSFNQRKEGTKKPESREAWSRRQNKRRKLLKEKAVAFLGGKCCICGYCRYYGALEFHHKKPEEKTMPLDAGSLIRVKWEVVEQELKKCVLVCAVCHREIEAGITSVPDDITT